MIVASDALHERIALVTGATKGIGRAIATALAAAGATVVLTARTSADLDDVSAGLRATGATVHGIVCDVTNAAAVRTLAETLDRTVGGLDILVNNAGGAPRFGGFFDLDDTAWEDAFALNVLSAVRVVRCVTPLLRRSPYGRIIMIGSATAIEPGRSNPHYSASKAALLNLSKALSSELAENSITVNTISAGAIESAAWDRLFAQRSAAEGRSVEEIGAEALAFERAKIPLGRIGLGDDVAAMAALLASDAGAWITGTSIVIDGGKARSIF